MGKTEPSRVHFLGIAIDPITLDAAAERCVAWCRGGSSPRLVVAINAATVVASRSNSELRSACLQADLALPDGAPVVWAARLAGAAAPERVTGIDLMQRLVDRASTEGLSIFLLGATPEVLSRLVEVYRKSHPGLRIAGSADGFFPRSEEAALVARIRASGADILLIGMPTPYKEVFAQTFRDTLRVSVVLGVGDSFDVASGMIPRAPQWMQRCGLEWSWRLLREPRRLWRRYLFGNSYFLLLMVGLAFQRILRIRK